MEVLLFSVDDRRSALDYNGGMKQIFVVESSGDRELFDARKLASSLHKAGATDEQANRIVSHIEGEIIDGISSNDIYRHAFDLLRAEAVHVAARYSMKRAISELGPDGFPFEKFIAELFKARGYEALTNQILQGGCVEHEVDVVAWNKNEIQIVEAKFHNEPGFKSDLKVALYIKARFDDLKEGVFSYGGPGKKIHKFHLITNTKFTEHAIRYAECKKLSMMGWNYPVVGNLEDWVNETGLQPITSMLVPSKTEKQLLLKNGVIVCQHIIEKKDKLVDFGIPKDKIDLIVDEAEHIIA